MRKAKFFFLVFSSLFLIITLSTGLAVFFGLLGILSALLILIISDVALAIFASSAYYRQLYRGELFEILLSPELLDIIFSLFLSQLVILFPLVISIKARSPLDVIFLAPLGLISCLILSLKFPLGLFTKIEPLSYPTPYKVYVAKFEKIKEANAVVSGIFKPRIILFSPLFEFLNNDEVKAVVAHEMGHIANRDHIKLLFGLIISIIGIEILALSIYYELVGDGIGGLLFLLSMLLAFFFPLLSSYYWRRMELKADLYASRVVGKETYISALRKLAEHNLLPLDWGSGDHPSIERRIEYVLKNCKNSEY
jgi:Zn-dependent protease with chaperone function